MSTSTSWERLAGNSTRVKNTGVMYEFRDKFWGKPLSEFITIRNIPRDGERPDVSAPKTVLFIEHELHCNRGIIIRDAYLRALGHILAKCWRNDKNNELSLGPGPILNNPFEDKELVPNAPLKTSAPVVSVSGQSGIGKTLWLYFVLMLRLSAKLPTIFQPYSDVCYYFHEKGVDEYKDDQLLDVTPCTETWIWWLIDSNQGNLVSYARTNNRSQFILYTASPRRDRFKWLSEYLWPSEYYMEPWSTAELICAQVARQKPVPESTIVRYAELYGHNVRRIGGLGTLDCEFLWEKSRVEQALQGMNLKHFEDELRQLGCFIEDHRYEAILTVVPDPHNPFRRPSLTFATHHLFREVYSLLTSNDTAKSNRLYAAMNRLFYANPIAGLIYQHRARDLLQSGDELTLYPMVSILKNAELYVARDDSSGPAKTVRHGVLRRIWYNSEREVTNAEPSCYYVPAGSNQATFDAFFHESDQSINRFTVFQMMPLANEHDVKPDGLKWLKRIDARASIRYIAVTPSATNNLKLTMKPEDGELVQEWYQLFYDIPKNVDPDEDTDVAEPSCFSQ
ncbi:hypothetical protein BC835DRAFT_1379432 [Cytidiella melzeri]|nr:hypothetical protein BC835DRAFT_1379432 [Cytidiella melzeri]